MTGRITCLNCDELATINWLPAITPKKVHKKQLALIAQKE